MSLLRCPNCEQPCGPEHLVSNEFAVQHCGCFYDQGPFSTAFYRFHEECDRRAYMDNPPRAVYGRGMQLHLRERTAGGVAVEVSCKPLLELDPDRDAGVFDVPDTDEGLAKLRLRLAERAGPAFVIELSRRLQHPKSAGRKTDEYIVDVVITQRFGVGVEP